MGVKENIAEDRLDMVSGELEESGSQEVRNAGLLIKLMDPYMYDGEEVKELDLNCLYDLTAKDLEQIDAVMLRNGYSGQNMELLNKYAMLTVARALKRSWEFCDNMKARDVIRIKNIVSGFFYMRVFK